MFATNLFRGLAANLDLGWASDRSFKNWHARGANYVCLHRTEDLTVKLYVFRPGEFTLNEHDLVVHPHDHAYDFSSVTLAGEMKNIIFERDIRKVRRTKGYRSFVKTNDGHTTGQAKFEPGELTWLGEVSTTSHKLSGEGFFMRHDQVHSIWVNPAVFTAILQCQYRRVAKPHTSLFLPSMSASPPNLDGLYRQMLPCEVGEILREVNEHVFLSSAQTAHPIG